MRRFSNEEDRSHVFDLSGAGAQPPKIQEGDWIDLYEMLQIAPDVTSFELDERIIERGADAVYFAVSRHGKPSYIVQLEKHLPEMRHVLLDPEVRQRYDEQCRLHREKDPKALSYNEFLKTIDLREYAGCLSAMLFICLPLLAWWLVGIA